MNQANGQAGNAPTAGKHARQNSRIVPVIPRLYSRKSVDKKTPKQNVTAPWQEAHAASRQHPDESAGVQSASVSNGKINGSSQAHVQPGGAESRSLDGATKVADENESQASVGADSVSTLKSTSTPPATSSRVTDGTSAKHIEIPETPETLDQAEKTRQAHTSATKFASVRSPVHFPPPFYPASHSDANVVVQNQVAAEPRAGNRRSFVFGGNVDSSAPSPIPPPSAGSWKSSLGVASITNGTTSPPPMPINGNDEPAVTSNGYAIPPTSSQNPANHVPQAQLHPHSWQPQQLPALPNGHAAHVQRQIPRDGPVQSPRSGSIGSNPSDAPFPPQYPTYPAPLAVQTYPISNNDNMMGTQRGMPFSPYSSSFTPTRGPNHFESRYIAEQDLHSAIALRSHAESLLGNLEFADTVLQMPSSFNGPSRIVGHSFVLSRSPRLRSALLDTTRRSVTTHKDRECQLIEISDDAVFRDGGLFTVALRTLYGGGVIRRENLPSNLKSPKQVMAWVMSYASAGWYLEIPEIATAGLNLATELLIIDNVDVALDFALATGTKRIHKNGSNGNQNGPSAGEAPYPKYAPYAVDFLFATLRFITWPLVNNFEFDATAPQLESVKRFPEQLQQRSGPFSHSSRPSASNPKLQGIQLGEFQLHSSVNRTLSSILLSIPTFALQSLFGDRIVIERLSPEARAGLLQAIVTERESRRATAVAGLDRLDDGERESEDIIAVREALNYAEKVEVTQPDSGFVALIQIPANTLEPGSSS